MLAIFWDAAVGHGLTWENDPYWTYWVTKTFLIFTVFALGTAWLGTGLGRGAVITAVHTLVLTIYYWTFAPIGLPSSPDWLDLEHTWLTGLPIHFGVIYLGYLSALWLWRRRSVVGPEPPGREALVALVAGLAVVVLAGGFASLAVYDWPGVTYFLTRLLITVPFVLLWFALAGRDWLAAVGGAVTLAFIWATYGEFLGPVGLPDTPLRILDQQPPPAVVNWLDYRDTWLISLPIYLVAMALVLLATYRLVPTEDGGRRSRGWVALGPALGVIALVAAPIALANIWVSSGGTLAEVASSGPGQIETGSWFSGEMSEGTADLTLTAEDKVRRVSTLEPHDVVDVRASVEHPDGTTYEVMATEPMVSDPLGRYTTWWGVGVDVWHHGRSGIGTDQIPATRSEVAIFALGEVSADGRPIARNVPVHVMTGRGDADDPLMLVVGDPAAAIPSLPNGHLLVEWGGHTGGADRDDEWVRYALGGLVLVLLLGLVLGLNVRGIPLRS